MYVLPVKKRINFLQTLNIERNVNLQLAANLVISTSSQKIDYNLFCPSFFFIIIIIKRTY